jgi:uncharacterized protein (TIGR02246 family)
MRTVIVIVFTLALTVPTVAQAPSTSSADDAAIRRVLQQHDDARNKGDWKALGDLFTQDAEQLTSSGDWRRGRSQIEKGTAQITTTTYKGGKYTTRVERVRMLAPGVAIADGTFEIANIGSGGSRRGNTTYVLVKSGDRWQIAAARSMVPTPVGPSPPR